MSATHRSMLLMIVFAALWAAVEAVALHLSRGYSPFQVVWTRYAVHLAFMLLVWGWGTPRSLIATRRPLYQLARSSLMLVMPASFILGVSSGLDNGTLLAIFWDIAAAHSDLRGGAFARIRFVAVVAGRADRGGRRGDPHASGDAAAPARAGVADWNGCLLQPVCRDDTLAAH